MISFLLENSKEKECVQMADNKIKVLMIGPGRDVKGGISTVVNQYYEAHLDEMVQLKYIATMEDGNKLKKLLIAAKALVQFKHCVKDYDIVHVHMASRASFYRKSYFVKIAYAIGKKIVIHMHGGEFDVFYNEECNANQRENVRKIFAMADVVIALSDSRSKFLGKICDSKKVMTLYNSVVLPAYQKNDYQDQNVLFLGRLGKRKGAYDLIEAMPKVITSCPDVHFYLGGDGEIEMCRQKCEEMGISDYVTFLGWVKGKDKVDILKKCSIYVLPSYHEGMPMSVLEAMSYGLATVSTTIGGIANVIDDGKDGILIVPGDKDKIADSLIILLQHPIYKKQIGKAGRTKIEDKFNLDRMVLKLVAEYQKIINRQDSGIDV